MSPGRDGLPLLKRALAEKLAPMGVNTLIVEVNYIMCDWHYEKRPEGYPSVVYLQEKGFRMLPSTWRSQDAALSMLREARTKATPKMLGHLCTTWVGAQGFCRALLDEPPPEDTKPKADAKAKRQRGPGDIVAALKACMEELTRVEAPTK
jgi:hypothetical protein